jgi:glycosyltransferase involved in cell wall biosynthesis
MNERTIGQDSDMHNNSGRTLMLVENPYPQDIRVRNEARSLVQAGYGVSVIAIRKPGEKLAEIVDGVRVYRVPKLTLFQKTRTTDTSFVGRWLGRVKSTIGYVVEYLYFTSACLLISSYAAIVHGFDVVHAHNPPDTLFLVGALHKIFGKKFVFDHHDLSPELYRSRFGAPVDNIVRALEFVEYLSYRVSDLTIATNESYRDVAYRRGGLTPDRVAIVRNGPDLKRIRVVEPDAALKATGKSILLYLGEMNPQDGVDYMVKAVRHLRYELGRTDFFCVAIGDGDSLEDLKAAAVAARLEDCLQFTGRVSEDDLRRYLSTADICLDPNPSSPLNDVSTWIKVMEYMAVGAPTVSFDLKETRFTARDAAVYVRPNDVGEFAAAIAMLMDDPALRARMGAFARARIEQELNWGVVSTNLVAAYQNLFDAGARAGAAAQTRHTTQL